MSEEEGIRQRGTEMGKIIKGYEESFWSDRYTLSPDCGDAFVHVDIYQN